MGTREEIETLGKQIESVNEALTNYMGTVGDEDHARLTTTLADLCTELQAVKKGRGCIRIAKQQDNPVELMNVRKETSSIHIWATLRDDGDLVVQGVDCEEEGEAMTGADSDYEYALTIPAAEIGKVVDVLKAFAKRKCMTLLNLSNDQTKPYCSW